MIKKTSIDRNSVYGLFESIDFDFARTLLAQSFPELQTVPSIHDIDYVLTKVGNQEFVTKDQWTEEEDDFLRLVVLGTCLQVKTIPQNLVFYTSSQSPIQWDQLSKIFKLHKWRVCRSRFLLEKPKKITWTPEEDSTLIKLQAQYPNRWCEIATQLMKICKTPYIRQGKQCRDRWVNKLDPKILNIPWYKEEELRLFQEVKRRGKKWADISSQVFRFKRTENTIKNRFYNLLKQEENRKRLGRVPKEERDLLLIDSVIETLTNELRGEKKGEVSNKREETNSENNEYYFKEFLNLDEFEIVIIKGRKIQKNV